MPESTAGQRTLIVDGRVVDDQWLRLDDEPIPPGAQAMIPLARWRATPQKPQLAPWLHGDTELDADLAEALATAPLVAVDFPRFTDGRGYTLARLLRERFGYGGQLRAVGDVLVDQLFFLARCGFNAFSLRADQDSADALRALESFTVTYQTAADSAEPVFRRRSRPA